jgi:hypothetical protein
MPGLVGADADELDRLGTEMRRTADLLDGIQRRIAAQYRDIRWEGPDGEHHRGQWNYRLSGMVHTAVLAAQDAAVRLHVHADQQRRASGAGGGVMPETLGWPGSVAGGGGGFDWQRIEATAGILFGAAGQLMLAPDALKVFGERGLFKDFLGQPAVKQLLADHDLMKAAKDAEGLRLAGEHLGKLGPLDLLSVYFDGKDFITGLATDPHAPETYQAGINTIFDLAEIATALNPPLALTIGAVHLGYNVLEEIHPGAGKEAFEAVVGAGMAVADAATDAFNSHVQGVQNVVGAAADIAGGGVDAVKSFFHW